LNAHITLEKLRDSLFPQAVRPTRVLVVDDEEGVCKFVARVLQSGGYAVETANGGAAALEKIDAGATFDLVVSDVRMPAMSGPRFVEQLRRAGCDAKVLYLTGYVDQLFFERSALWADEAFLDKPCTVKGLLESVALLLTGHVIPPPPGFSAPSEPQH
jgi:two-component system, cell cycle sensor histidine kinase and response regulator CckA